MKVSVVLPTYNEAKNIVRLVAEIKVNLPDPWTNEILIVDDDSPDGTMSAASAAYSLDSSVKLISRKSDHGLAKSIRAGIETATGDFVLVMDTDFTHRPDEIPLMLYLIEMVDLVSGSRFCPGGSMDSRTHYLASFLYNLVIRVIIRTQVQDNLGGFWVAHTDRIRTMPLDRIFFGYGDYYFRLLHYMQHAGTKVVELPAHYTERAAGKSKSNFLKLLFRYSAQAIALAIRNRHYGD